MQERLSADTVVENDAVISTSLSGGQKALLLFANYFPLLHVSCLIACWIVPQTINARLIAFATILLLLPPLLTRLTFLIFGKPAGTYQIGQREFFVWWFALQYQVLFCRLPWIEECLRLVPGLYSFWLRLWGSRIGSLTYWAAGTTILDRSYLSIGDGVVFGAGVRLNPHVLHKDRTGSLVLAIAPVSIGEKSSIGGYSLLTAGSSVAERETTASFLRLPPFNSFVDGKRRKPDAA